MILIEFQILMKVNLQVDVFTLADGTISWKITKQTCIARSTTESEFIALYKEGEKVEWLMNFLIDTFLCDLNHFQLFLSIVIVKHLFQELKIHPIIKSLDSSIGSTLLCFNCLRMFIVIDYVKSSENIVDSLTK